MAQFQSGLTQVSAVVKDRSPPKYSFFHPDEHIFQVAGLLYVDGGYLLARQRESCEAVYKVAGQWSAVIGALESSELHKGNLKEALQREVEEELGIKNKVWPTQFLGLAQVNMSIMLCWLIELEKEGPLHQTNKRDRKEIIEVQHFPISKTRALIKHTPEVFRIPTVDMIQNHWLQKAGLTGYNYLQLLKKYASVVAK